MRSIRVVHVTNSTAFHDMRKATVNGRPSSDMANQYEQPLVCKSANKFWGSLRNVNLLFRPCDEKSLSVNALGPLTCYCRKKDCEIDRRKRPATSDQSPVYVSGQSWIARRCSASCRFTDVEADWRTQGFMRTEHIEWQPHGPSGQ